jgi:hypothetical protein
MKNQTERILHILLFIIVSAFSTATSAVPFGRFLLNPVDSSIVYSYGDAAPTAFDQNVFCGTTKCGEIKFDYDTYLKKPDGTTTGGGALSGGFYIDPTLTVSPGHHLAWIQTVFATRSGSNNDWGITVGNVWYPDASRTNPEYPYQTTAATPPNPPGTPTVGFQDFPNRFFSDGNQSWLAELGLACIDDIVGANGFRQAYVIDTFLWGFGVGTNPNVINVNAPHGWSAPSDSYLTTLNDYYDGSPPNPPTSGGSSSKFNFQVGCDNCFIPTVDEPGTLTLLVWGMVGFLPVLRRVRQKARVNA